MDPINIHQKKQYQVDRRCILIPSCSELSLTPLHEIICKQVAKRHKGLRMPDNGFVIHKLAMEAGTRRYFLTLSLKVSRQATSLRAAPQPWPARPDAVSQLQASSQDPASEPESRGSIPSKPHCHFCHLFSAMRLPASLVSRSLPGTPAPQRRLVAGH